jgi:aminoglycoside 6'-N-acetyltransferase
MQESNENSDAMFITGSLSVRRMRDNGDDRALLLNWLTDPNGVITVAWKEEIPWDAQKIEEAFFADFTHEKLIPCIVEQDGRAIGHIQFYPLDEESYRFNKQVTFIR